MGRTITRILASAILVVLYVVFASPCVGQVSDLDLNGDLTLYFTRLVDGQGNLTGYRYDGSVGGLDLNYNLPVSVDIGIKSSKLGQPGLLWSEVSNWNNPALGIFNLVNITKAVVGPAIGKPSIHDTLVGLDTLINGGPTERSVSIYKVPVLRITSPDLPTLDLNFEAGLGLKFDVYLASGADVLMDQRVVLERLTVYPGAKVTGNNTFVTRTDLDNWGVFQNLMGTIEGNFINVGAPQGQGHAVIMGSLNVQGQLINTGEIRINSGSLNLAQSTANDGVLIIDGGSLDCAGGFSNFGTTEWGNGAVSVNGDLLNFGTFTLVGTDPKIIKKNGVLTNANMITHLEEGVLVFCDEATLNNLEGGLYDFQGDGNIAVGHSSAGWAKNTVFNNAGTLRKSAGMGESTISVPFNNTGTIEVSSGTLTFKGPSSSTDGNFVLANGGRLRFASHTCYLQGVNTVTGNGVMEVDGATVEVSDGATAMFGSNSGGSLLVTGNLNRGKLRSVNGGTLTLDYTGTGTVKLISGTVGGAGVTINNGNFEWSGGFIDGTGGLTNTSDSFTVVGSEYKFIKQKGVLTNAGTITHFGEGDLVLWNGAILNNLEGGVYDFQGDAGMVGASGHPYDQETVNNAGTFRKSAGDGESVINRWVVFNNTGTVEVSSGTLTFKRPASSIDGNFVLANGGHLRFYGDHNASYTCYFQGINTVTGNGVMEVDGATVEVSDGATAMFGSNSGGSLLVTGNLNRGKLRSVNGGTLTLGYTGTGTVKLISGTVGGAGVTINNGNFEWSGGFIDGTGGLTNTSDSFTVVGSEYKIIKQNGVLTNSGTITHLGEGDLAFWSGATLNNLESGLYDLQADGSCFGYDSGGTINNAGTFRKSGGEGEWSTNKRMAFYNTGTVEVQSGTLTFKGGYTQTAGVTKLNGGTVTATGTLNIQGGAVIGSGTINANVFSNGSISPGDSPGMLIIDGDYAQGASGTLLIEIAGSEFDQFDVLAVTGKATLNGTLEISLLDGFVPSIGDTFEIFTFSSRNGEFATINGLDLGDGMYFDLGYSTSGLTLETVPEPATILLMMLGGIDLLRRRQAG